MRTHLSGLAVALIAVAAALPAGAQAQASEATTAPPSIITFASSADVAGLIAKARSDRKPGQALVTEPLLRLAPYGPNLEYRPAVGPAAVHETEAEMFYVIDGAGTLVTGGKLVGEVRANAANLTGTGIDGGVARKVGKGDVFIVPQNTPHWFSTIDGVLVLVSLHVPRTSPPAR